MAGGVNIKMGVSGVNEVKRHMKDVQNSAKTLDAALALNEKQFKATGDSETYMSTKTELLNTKIEQQKSIIHDAETALKQMTDNGVDKASKAYQDMQQQLLKAKGELVDTEQQMQGVENAGNDAASSIGSMNSELQSIGTQVSFDTVTNGIDRITGGLESAAKSAYKVGKAIVTQVLGAGSWADDINTTAKVLGVTPEELQRMQKTANIIDTDAETIIKARQKLAKNVGTGNAGAMSALEAMGINVDPENVENAFWAAGEAIMNMTDETEQEAKANALFGKSWHDLIPLFSAGRDEYEAMNESWNVLSEEQLNALNDMDDEYQKLKEEVEYLKMEALSNLAEPMKTALEAINGLLGSIGDWLKSDEGKATVENIVTKITEAAQWIVDNKETVIGALSAIVAGWAGLKLTGGALKVLQLINGIKGLTGGVSTAASAAGSAAGSSFAAGFTNAFVTAAPALASILGITAAAITPALIAQQNDEKRWAQQKQERLLAAENLTGGDKEFMLNSAEALDQHYAPTGSAEEILTGLNRRGTIEKAKLFSLLSGQATSYGNYATDELLRFWSGEGDWDQARTEALLTTVTDAYAKMSELAESNSSGKTDTASKNNSNWMKDSLSSALTGAMTKLKVVMDGQTVGEIVGPYVDAYIAGQIQQ